MTSRERFYCNIYQDAKGKGIKIECILVDDMIKLYMTKEYALTVYRCSMKEP
jgi:hypothetical protein